MTQEIEQIKSALKDITQGNWEDGPGCIYVPNEIPNKRMVIGVIEREKDSYFVANAPTWLVNLITTIESLQKENEQLRQIIAKLPDKIMDMSWSDTEELTFPLIEPTEEMQSDWLDEFIRRLDDHVIGCFDGAMFDLKYPNGIQEVNRHGDT